MDPDDDVVIAQIGLLLTQVRYARRALEDIERSTARYAGFEFASALSQGKAFGAPPLANGALKVYLVNIDDLVPTNSIGDLLSGLLGGAGRFISGVGGGFVGGFLGALALPDIIDGVTKIAASVERILDRLGITSPNTGAAAANISAAETAAQKAEKGAGTDWKSILKDLKETAKDFTALFQAAGGDPDKAGKTSNLPSTSEGNQWMAMLESVYRVLDGIRFVVDGLILLIPNVLGGIALLIVKLDAIKLSVVQFLQFAYQNVFLLRGILLLTLFDTAAAAARVVGSILGTLGTAVSTIIQSLFSIVGIGLRAALTAFDFIGAGLARTVDAVVVWLGQTLFTILNRIADTALFRVILHIVNILPKVLPPLFEIIRDVPLPPEYATALGSIQPIPGGTFTDSVPKITPTPFPNIAATFAPAKPLADLNETVTAFARDITNESDKIFVTARGAVEDVAKKLDMAATSGNADFAKKAEAVGKSAEQLAGVLDSAQKSAAKGSPTGLEEIATQYEKWLASGGLNTVLGSISDHFKARPELPSKAETGTRPANATVEIESVTFEIAPPPVDSTKSTAPAQNGTIGTLTPEDLRRMLDELSHDHEERGGSWIPA